MKVLALIPVWKRPEVLEITVKNLPKWLNTLYIVSEEDPFFKENIKILGKKDVCFYENEPVSQKQNAGLRLAILDKWDYLMNLGSDTLLNHSLIDVYKPLMEKETPLFGLTEAYFTELSTLETHKFTDYDQGRVFGGGRMIHRSVIEELYKNDLDLWPSHLNRGMDGASRLIMSSIGVTEVAVKSDLPLIMDLKTSTNINTLPYLLRVGGQSLKQVQFEEIEAAFFKTKISQPV